MRMGDKQAGCAPHCPNANGVQEPGYVREVGQETGVSLDLTFLFPLALTPLPCASCSNTHVSLPVLVLKSEPSSWPLAEEGKQVALGIQAREDEREMTGRCRQGLGCRETRREASVGNPGNKVNGGPFIRKPTFVISSALPLVRGGRHWGPYSLVL